MSRVLRLARLATACAALLACMTALPAAAQSTGAISGRVSSADWNSYLEGADVRLPRLNMQAVTDREGRFTFIRVPAGTHVLVVSYLGSEAREVEVVVQAGRTTVQEVTLTSAALRLGALLASAQLQGQAAAANLQRTSDNLKTVVSQDALGQTKEGNIGDALARLPGVVVETRAGVQRTATIRGLLPQYNNVTVDGLPMTNVDGNRDIALDSYPANTLERVEVTRALTPNMPGDAIGGSVNLVTRTAFDRPGRTLFGNLGGTHNAKRQNWNSQAELTFGDRLGADQQLGYLLTASYFEDNRGYDVSNIGYTVSQANAYSIANNFVYDRYERKQKFGLGANLDFRPTDQSHLYVKGMYNYDYRWLNHMGTDYRPTNNQVNSIAFYREPKNVFQMYIAGGRHELGATEVDYRASYSRADKTYPVTFQVTTGFNAVGLEADRTDPNFPTFRVTNGASINDPSRLVIRNMQSTQAPRNEDEFAGEVNLRQAMGGVGFPLSLQGGLRFSAKDAAQAQDDYARYTVTGLTAAELMMENYRNDRFFLESNGRATILPFIPDWRKWQNAFQTRQSSFARVEPFSSQGVANNEFDIAERIESGYGMATVDIGQLRLLGGVRVEHTMNEATANEVRIERIDNQERVTGVTPRTSSNSYTNVLPGLHARYDATRDLALRASWTNTISRPAPGDLIPSMQVNAQLTQPAVIIGNPDLVPAESMNLDASAEYYMTAAGLLSVAVYHKQIEKFVFSERTRLNSGPFAGFDEVRRVNGEGGSVTGLELAWVQQLRFLPGPLAGFGVESNVSFVSSEAVYPGRESETLPLAGPADRVINAILSYTAGGFNGRLSYMNRSERLASVGGRAELDRYNAADYSLDFASSLRLPRGGALFFNVHNMLNQPTVEYQGSPEFPTSTTYYGAQLNFGLRFDR